MLTAVTGATGHLGANLVRLLLREGHRVRALVRRNRRALEGLAVETVSQTPWPGFDTPGCCGSATAGGRQPLAEPPAARQASYSLRASSVSG